MNDIEVGRLWEKNADAWTKLARLGCDKWRDLVNAPAFQKMLPDVVGKLGLDVGCGEGYNTRLTTARGARIVAFDISRRFVKYSQQEARRTSSDIKCLTASAVRIPFKASSFDFVMATMTLMDAPDHPAVFAEIFRVLKPGGFLQFSIMHPCFANSDQQWDYDQYGQVAGYIVRNYFFPHDGFIDEWIFKAASEEKRAGFKNFRIPRFDMTLSGWINLIIETGFRIERLDEPHPAGDVRKHFSKYADSGLIPFSLIIRCRKTP